MRRPTRSRKLTRWSVGFMVLVLAVAATLVWGGAFLVDADPPPNSAHAVVVLRGSTASSRARLAGGARLIDNGVSDRLLLSVSAGSYWGESIPDLVRRYVERKYAPDAAERYSLCINDSDSTGEEALALHECIARRGWRNVVVVTSDYHTRRAKLIWSAVAEASDTPLRVSVVGVPDDDFEPRGWWRKRRYAKTWFLEVQKLLWYFIEGLPERASERVEY